MLTRAPPSLDLDVVGVTRFARGSSTDRERGVDTRSKFAPTAKAGKGGVGWVWVSAIKLGWPGAGCVSRSDRRSVSLESAWPEGWVWMVMGNDGGLWFSIPFESSSEEGAVVWERGDRLGWASDEVGEELPGGRGPPYQAPYSS